MAKLFRGLHVTEETYFVCSQCLRTVGSIGPDDSLGDSDLPGDIETLLADWHAHQENACDQWGG